MDVVVTVLRVPRFRALNGAKDTRGAAPSRAASLRGISVASFRASPEARPAPRDMLPRSFLLRRGTGRVPAAPSGAYPTGRSGHGHAPL
jgi:hypothetical protein